MNNLPASKEFPEDSISETFDTSTPLPKTEHGNYRMEGRDIICTTCPNTHTLPLDPDKFTVVNGEIVKNIK